MLELLIIPTLIVAYAVWVFNRLVSLRARARGSWADIDVQLKKRWDLVPRLVETVKGYAAHESGTLEEVMRARGAAQAAGGERAGRRAEAEVAMGRGMGSLIALVEAYPDLKADEMFGSLHSELVQVEDALQSARRYYNAVVRDLNTKARQFPSNMIAGMTGVKAMEYFELDDDDERRAPRVDLDNR